LGTKTQDHRKRLGKPITTAQDPKEFQEM